MTPLASLAKQQKANLAIMEAKATTAADIRKTLASFEKAMQNPMLDYTDKAKIRELSEELISQLEDLEREVPNELS